ncbi:MAG: TonB family protein [Akkermansiaceae bacterium]|jgi:TonB family protein
MKLYSSTTIGIACAAAVLALLAIARLWMPKEQADIVLRDIATITLNEPPPPPPPTSEPPPDAPPPPPALTEISEVPDPSRVPIPKAKTPLDITLPVEPFFTEVEVSPLAPRPDTKPRPSEKQTSRQAKRTPSTAPTSTNRPKPEPIPVRQKANYEVSELDGSPRRIRTGRTAFPRGLARKGVTKGTVVFEVELSTSGSVRVIRVVSSTHPELIAAARKVARESKFTSPTRKGQPVTAIMRWPVTIQR